MFILWLLLGSVIDVPDAFAVSRRSSLHTPNLVGRPPVSDVARYVPTNRCTFSRWCSVVSSMYPMPSESAGHLYRIHRSWSVVPQCLQWGSISPYYPMEIYLMLLGCVIPAPDAFGISRGLRLHSHASVSRSSRRSDGIVLISVFLPQCGFSIFSR
jgi:hypothetical protein